MFIPEFRFLGLDTRHICLFRWCTKHPCLWGIYINDASCNTRVKGHLANPEPVIIRSDAIIHTHVNSASPLPEEVYTSTSASRQEVTRTHPPLYIPLHRTI